MKLVLFLAAGLCLSAPAQALCHEWYPQSCCAGKDCEAIPIDGVMETATGYHVLYLSPRFGPIDETIPKEKARFSEDGKFHGCWRANPVSPRTICFFAPVNT